MLFRAVTGLKPLQGGSPSVGLSIIVCVLYRSWEVVLCASLKVTEVGHEVFDLAGTLVAFELPFAHPSLHVATPEDAVGLTLRDCFGVIFGSFELLNDAAGHVIDEGVIGHEFIGELDCHTRFLSYCFAVTVYSHMPSIPLRSPLRLHLRHSRQKTKTRMQAVSLSMRIILVLSSSQKRSRMMTLKSTTMKVCAITDLNPKLFFITSNFCAPCREVQVDVLHTFSITCSSGR